MAFGCLNDNESPQHEREFRSSYLAPIFARQETKRDRSFRFEVATVGGIVLLSGAVVVAWKSSQPGN